MPWRNLAREDVPDEVALAYGKNLTFGRDYIIPHAFDPRLIHRIPPAVAKAGMDTVPRVARSSTWKRMSCPSNPAWIQRPASCAA